MNGQVEANENGIILLPDEDMFYRRENMHPIFDVQEGEMTTLQQYIDSEEWEPALERLRSHPQEVHHPKAQPGSKHKGMTALHLCLENTSCPLPVLQALLARKPLAAAMQDAHGNTPLHIACAGEFAYDHFVIGSLLAAYPQAVLIQEEHEKATPLHLLLKLGGDVNLTCLSMLLDVAYSRMAGLPLGYVPLVDFICSPLEMSLQIAANYPPIIVQLARQIASEEPFLFPAYLQPFLHLPPPTTLEVPPQLSENQKKLLLLQDNLLQTPLHTTCSRGLPIEVVRIIVNEQRYPGAHQAARILERKNRYPLFYSACYEMPFDATKIVFDLYPDAIRHIDSYRLLYIHMCYISTIHSREDRKLELVTGRDNPDMPIAPCFRLESAFRLWRLFEFFLRLTYHESYAEPPPGRARWRILHALAAVQSPPQVIRTSIQLHPWQLRERDEDGNLPLHLACKNMYPEGNDGEHFWCLQGVNREKVHHRLEPYNLERDNPVTILTESFREGASYLDSDGCLPLHSAICCGRGWRDGIQSLITANPNSLSTRCGKFFLHPFMLAAMDNVNTLDSVFELLLSNPSLVHMGIRHDTAPNAKDAPDEDTDMHIL